MKRSIRRKGKLLQKSQPKDSFKVFAIENKSQDVSFIGEYASFDAAKQMVDKDNTSGVSFYIYNNNSNRVLYEREKS